MIRLLALLLGCLVWTAVSAGVDDAAPIYRAWHIDRVIVGGSERKLEPDLKVQFDGRDDAGLIRGSLNGWNSHVFVYKADGHRLVASCGINATAICTSTLRGRRIRRVDDQGVESSVSATPDPNFVDDGDLAKLFTNGDAYWKQKGSGITIRFVASDTRIELSPWAAESPPGR